MVVLYKAVYLQGNVFHQRRFLEPHQSVRLLSVSPFRQSNHAIALLNPTNHDIKKGIGLVMLSQKKYERYEKYKSHALTLFVAIPFPGTGAWTGSLISYAIGLNKKKSAFCIVKGVLISGIIMTFLSVSGKVIIG